MQCDGCRPALLLLCVAMLHNHLLFGDVPVGVSRQVSFTLTSRSNMAVYRFEAPHREGLVFSPSQGHLHPGASKEITVSLRSNKLLVLKREALDLQLCKITFPQPLSQVHALHCNTPPPPPHTHTHTHTHLGRSLNLLQTVGTPCPEYLLHTMLYLLCTLCT